MTARCQICGATVEAAGGPMLLNPFDNPEAAMAIREISTFDLLAGRMHAHLAMCHQDQAAEMAAIMFLAGKVYAMTWAESAEPEYQALRESWRSGILNMLQSTSNPVKLQADAPSSDPPSESNAKEVSKERFQLRTHGSIVNDQAAFRFSRSQRDQTDGTGRLKHPVNFNATRVKVTHPGSVIESRHAFLHALVTQAENIFDALLYGHGLLCSVLLRLLGGSTIGGRSKFTQGTDQLRKEGARLGQNTAEMRSPAIGRRAGSDFAAEPRGGSCRPADFGDELLHPFVIGERILAAATVGLQPRNHALNDTFHVDGRRLRLQHARNLDCVFHSVVRIGAAAVHEAQNQLPEDVAAEEVAGPGGGTAAAGMGTEASPAVLIRGVPDASRTRTPSMICRFTSSILSAWARMRVRGS